MIPRDPTRDPSSRQSPTFAHLRSLSNLRERCERTISNAVRRCSLKSDWQVDRLERLSVPYSASCCSSDGFKEHRRKRASEVPAGRVCRVSSLVSSCFKVNAPCTRVSLQSLMVQSANRRTELDRNRRRWSLKSVGASTRFGTYSNDERQETRFQMTRSWILWSAINAGKLLKWQINVINMLVPRTNKVSDTKVAKNVSIT